MTSLITISMTFTTHLMYSVQSYRKLSNMKVRYYVCLFETFSTFTLSDEVARKIKRLIYVKKTRF